MSAELKQRINPYVMAECHKRGIRTVGRLAFLCGMHDRRVTVYRVLGEANKHVPLKTAITLAKKCGITLDAFAGMVLDHEREVSVKLLNIYLEKNKMETQYRLAIGTGLSTSTANQIIQGKYRYIELATYRTIARGIGITLGAFSELLLRNSAAENVLQTSSGDVTLLQSTNDELNSSFLIDASGSINISSFSVAA